MARMTARRGAWAEAATDFVLEHGLIGLSLRPLAAALGTSDRMLLYHFDGKDDLVATVLRVSNDRAVARVRELSPARDVGSAVRLLWTEVTTPALERCQRVYVEAAALGLFGREPYATVVGEANARWMKAVTDHLVASGAPRARAVRVAAVIDAAFSGFLLDRPLGAASGDRPAVEDLAEAVAALR